MRWSLLCAWPGIDFCGLPEGAIVIVVDVALLSSLSFQQAFRVENTCVHVGIPSSLQLSS